MCRIVAYLGEKIAINDVISEPEGSLIQQSRSARESAIEVNGDGFGVGWYNPSVEALNPAVYVSTLPAWNDFNLPNISHQIRSKCFFGHVRAADQGGVGLYNCHPFHYQHYMMMHNGGIAGFKHIKRDLIQLLDEELYLQIKGQTDSEHMFALWLQYFLPTDRSLSDMAYAWQQTIHKIIELQALHQPTKKTYINAVITDGKQFAIVRYCSQPEKALSLHYAHGAAFERGNDDHFWMRPAEKGSETAFLVASEKQTAHHEQWHEVPVQQVMTVDANLRLQGYSLA